MKSLIATLVLILGSGAMLFAADGANPSTQPSTQPAKAINKFCAVEGDNPIDAAGKTVEYKGKIIGFCCDDCIAKFEADPEKYMKTLK